MLENLCRSAAAENQQKYDVEIQVKKQKKFKRDVLDYTNKMVYKWQVEMEGIK